MSNSASLSPMSRSGTPASLSTSTSYVPISRSPTPSFEPLSIRLNVGGWPVAEGRHVVMTLTRAKDFCGAGRLTVRLAYGGSATRGQDFYGPDTLEIAADAVPRRMVLGGVAVNATTAVSNITIVDDAVPEDYETILVQVASASVDQRACGSVSVVGAALIVDDDKALCPFRDIDGVWITPDPAWRVPRYACTPGEIKHGPICIDLDAVKQRGEAPDSQTQAIFQPVSCSLSWSDPSDVKRLATNRTVVLVGDSVSHQHAQEMNCAYVDAFPPRSVLVESVVVLPCPPRNRTLRCREPATQTCVYNKQANARLCILNNSGWSITCSDLLLDFRNRSRWNIAGRGDVWVMNFGLHRMRLGNADEFADEYVSLMRNPPPDLPKIWFRQTSAQHFASPKGTGTYEDYRGNVDQGCVPITDNAGGLWQSGAHVIEALNRAGMPIIGTWNSTADRYMDHLAYSWIGQTHFTVEDCTHFCMGSSLYRHYNRLVFHYMRHFL